MLVFGFVDNATRYSTPQSLHRMLRRQTYVPGALVVAPDDQMQQEAELLARGGKPLPELSVSLWVKALREIDVFDWQETRAGVMSVAEVEFELGTGAGRVRRSVERGEIMPDHLVRIGDQEQAFFAKDRLDEVRDFLGVPTITRENVRELFFAFVAKMDMSSSYKPVFLRCFPDTCNDSGRARIEDVAKAFRYFYERRAQDQAIVEKPNSVFVAIPNMDQGRVIETMLKMPFEKFERRRFMRYAKDLAYIEFTPHLRRAMSTDDRLKMLELANLGINTYFRRFNG